MVLHKLISIIILVILTSSCNTGSDKANNVNKSQTKETKIKVSKENFPKGKIIESVICENDPTNTYSMYLPLNYYSEKKFPIIISFDPHSTGKLPVSMYKDLAEQYGYILIGSNNSKNGNSWEESEMICERLLTDVRNRLSVNFDRIYLMGFSGGARVANGITINNGAIAGVICCGASAPGKNSSNPRNNYTMIGIAGNEDFNYTEMRKYDLVDLAGHNVKHTLISFDGKHQWPPVETMEEAFWWLELNQMRKNPALRNESLITQKITPVLKQIEKLKTNKQMFDAFNLCKKTITFYDGLYDLSSCLADYKSFKTSEEINQSLKAEEISWSKEEELKQYYLKGFHSNDINKWQKEINSLNKMINTTKNKNEKLLYKRVLGYLSLVAYLQASGAINQNAISAADYFCKIYVLVDPVNNEAYYLTANVNAKQGKSKDAISSLNQAIKYGFIDLPRMLNDSSFSQIKNTGEFQEIINKLGKM